MIRKVPSSSWFWFQIFWICGKCVFSLPAELSFQQNQAFWLEQPHKLQSDELTSDLGSQTNTLKIEKATYQIRNWINNFSVLLLRNWWEKKQNFRPETAKSSTQMCIITPKGLVQVGLAISWRPNIWKSFKLCWILFNWNFLPNQISRKISGVGVLWGSVDKTNKDECEIAQESESIDYLWRRNCEKDLRRNWEKWNGSKWNA